MEASSRQDALKTFGETQIESAVTLDLRLGQSDGLHLAREMRAIRNAPLVMITGKDSQFDRIVGLEHGADDYIIKPFNLRETMLRIRNVLKRGRRQPPPPRTSARCRGCTASFTIAVLDLVKRELAEDRWRIGRSNRCGIPLLVLFVETPRVCSPATR